MVAIGFLYFPVKHFLRDVIQIAPYSSGIIVNRIIVKFTTGKQLLCIKIMWPDTSGIDSFKIGHAGTLSHAADCCHCGTSSNAKKP